MEVQPGVIRFRRLLPTTAVPRRLHLFLSLSRSVSLPRSFPSIDPSLPHPRGCQMRLSAACSSGTWRPPQRELGCAVSAKCRFTLCTNGMRRRTSFNAARRITEALHYSQLIRRSSRGCSPARHVTSLSQIQAGKSVGQGTGRWMDAAATRGSERREVHGDLSRGRAGPRQYITEKKKRGPRGEMEPVAIHNPQSTGPLEILTARSSLVSVCRLPIDQKHQRTGLRGILIETFCLSPAGQSATRHSSLCAS